MRVVWLLTGFSVLCGIADTIISQRSRPLFSEETIAVHGWPFVTLASIGATAMGALIISRNARHPVGWLLFLIGLTASISIASEAYALWVTSDGGPGPQSVANAFGWLSTLFGGAMSLSLFTLMFLLVPDGHWLSRRWRYVGWLAIAGVVFFLCAIATINPTSYNIADPEVDAAPLTGILSGIGFLLITIAIVASTVCLVVRLRRTHGMQHRQLRLIAIGAGLVAVGLTWYAVASILTGGPQTWIVSIPLFVSYFVLPFFFAVAVLRHRMYAVELIVNRATLLAVGTVFAAVGYIALVVTVSELIGSKTGSFWVSLLASALVALAFQPLREGAIRLANRLAFGSRAVPYEALADFNRRLGQSRGVDALLPAVAEAAGSAVSASRVTVRLQAGTDVTAAAAWPVTSDDAGATAGECHRVAIESGAEVLGSLDVWLPSGRSMRDSDARLLRDMADQAALAFRNVAMQLGLAAHVTALQQTTSDLAASRRRIIAADDVERRRLEAAIATHVTPPLRNVRAGLADVQARHFEAGSIEPLVASCNEALDALRTLTRGVFPTQLARSGLAPALRAECSRRRPDVELAIDDTLTGARFESRVESAAYFCCVEQLRDRSATALRISRSAADLVLDVVSANEGMVSQEVIDRVESVGGTWSSPPGPIQIRLPATQATTPGSPTAAQQRAPVSPLPR